MGYSSSGSQSGERRSHDNVADMFRMLQEFVGDWFVDQLVFSGRGGEPVGTAGRTTARLAIGRIAPNRITELPTSGFRGLSLIAYSPKYEQFELAFLDSLSDVGIGLLTGQLMMMTRSSEAICSQFGTTATVVREWSTGETSGLPGTAADTIDAYLPDTVTAAASASTTAESGSGSFRIVENKIATCPRCRRPTTHPSHSPSMPS
jgi:hypothetical protein